MQQEEAVNHKNQPSQPNGTAFDQAAGDDLPLETAPESVSAGDRASLEVAEWKDKYVRVFAEMENMRRRQERERGDIVKFSLEAVFKDLLPVLDSLDKALPDGGTANAPEAAAGYLEGMLMVKRQLLEVCKKHGLEPINARGAVFDPNVHQGIQRIESSDVATETVADEYARGYHLNGRLLRPAMVSVLTPAGS